MKEKPADAEATMRKPAAVALMRKPVAMGAMRKLATTVMKAKAKPAAGTKAGTKAGAKADAKAGAKVAIRVNQRWQSGVASLTRITVGGFAVTKMTSRHLLIALYCCLIAA